MDGRWFLLFYMLALGAWMIWAHRQSVAEGFAEAAGAEPNQQPSCRFVGSETATMSCPAHVPNKLGTIGHAGAALRCEASGGEPRTERGVPAELQAEVARGRLIHVHVLSPGAGYLVTPQLKFHGGVGNGAEARAVVSNGAIVRVDVIKPGYGYLLPPAIEIEPPAPTFSFCHLCCEADPLRQELKALRDRYDTLERILLEADVDVPPGATRSTNVGGGAVSAKAMFTQRNAEQALQRTGAGGGTGPRVTESMQATGVTDPIEREELAEEFTTRLEEYLKERAEEVQKANEFLTVIQKQQEREVEMKRMSDTYGLAFKPMYTDEYIAKIQWIADTNKRVSTFLAEATEDELVFCATKWKSYSTPPANLRPFEDACAAFPSARKPLPPVDPTNFADPAPAPPPPPPPAPPAPEIPPAHPGAA